jgi:hypothetical protein
MIRLWGLNSKALNVNELVELVIQYNHCVRYDGDFDVTIEIADENGKNILTKKFKSNLGTRLKIDRKEFGQLAAKSVVIPYREERKDGTDRIPGRINFV